MIFLPYSPNPVAHPHLSYTVPPGPRVPVAPLYRSCYRRQWGRPLMQRVLRRGAHWMLPDDHDVVNNLNWFHLMGVATCLWVGVDLITRRVVFRTPPTQSLDMIGHYYVSCHLEKSAHFYKSVRYQKNVGHRSGQEWSDVCMINSGRLKVFFLDAAAFSCLHVSYSQA